MYVDKVFMFVYNDLAAGEAVEKRSPATGALVCGVLGEGNCVENFHCKETCVSKLGKYLVYQRASWKLGSKVLR